MKMHPKDKVKKWMGKPLGRKTCQNNNASQVKSGALYSLHDCFLPFEFVNLLPNQFAGLNIVHIIFQSFVPAPTLKHNTRTTIIHSTPHQHQHPPPHPLSSHTPNLIRHEVDGGTHQREAAARLRGEAERHQHGAAGHALAEASEERVERGRPSDRKALKK